MKKCLVIRLGAFGDAVFITPVLRLLKQDGYHVTLHCKRQVKEVLENNPFVDEYLDHNEKMSTDEIEAYWEKIKKDYDRVINFSGSLEGNVLIQPFNKKALLPNYRLHEFCNKNYYDETLKWAGYGHITGLNGELFFSKEEEEWGKSIREQFKDKFLILWVLSGSSIHKTYPFAWDVACKLLDEHTDMRTITIGDPMCKMLEWPHKRNKRRAGLKTWNIRNSLIMTKYADLVVGQETGVLNAAGCFDTPKIILQSHSTNENISKYWKNCISLEPENCFCYPCHRLHYDFTYCNKEASTGGALCMAKISRKRLEEAILSVYNKKKVLCEVK